MSLLLRQMAKRFLWSGNNIRGSQEAGTLFIILYYQILEYRMDLFSKNKGTKDVSPSVSLPHSGTKKRWQDLISSCSKDWIVQARIIRFLPALLSPLGSAPGTRPVSLLSNLELGGAMARKSASVLINTCDRHIFGVTNNKIHDIGRLSGVPNHWWVKSCVISQISCDLIWLFSLISFILFQMLD